MATNKKQHQCDNCRRVFDDAELKIVLADIPDLSQRLDPGSVVPSGECPWCGALCYPVAKKPTHRRYLAVHNTNPNHEATGWEVRVKVGRRWQTVAETWAVDDLGNAAQVADIISGLLNGRQLALHG
jgi:hypothetical protein